MPSISEKWNYSTWINKLHFYLLRGADDLLPEDLEGEADLEGEEGLLYW